MAHGIKKRCCILLGNLLEVGEVREQSDRMLARGCCSAVSGSAAGNRKVPGCHAVSVEPKPFLFQGGLVYQVHNQDALNPALAQPLDRKSIEELINRECLGSVSFQPFT